MSTTGINTGKTFADFQLDVAVVFQLAKVVDGSGNPIAPILPTQPQRLDLLKRAVNAGYAALISGADPAGGRPPYTNWSFLERQITITTDPTGVGAQCVAGDAARYGLPTGIQSGPITQFAISAGGAWDGLQLTTPQRVASLLASQTSAGVPQLVAVRPLVVEGTPPQWKWEMLLWPKPASVFTIAGTYRLSFAPMVNNTDRPVSGPEMDYALLQLALLEFVRLDGARAGEVAMRTAAASVAMGAAVELDRSKDGEDLGPVAGIDFSGIRTRADARRAIGVTVIYQ